MNPRKAFASRIDANQPEIIRALEAAGVSVQPLHLIGKGCPDLLAGHNGLTVLLEIKRDYDYDRGARGIEHVVGQLTDDQARWHQAWHGQAVVIVRTPAEALACFGLDIALFTSPSRSHPAI